MKQGQLRGDHCYPLPSFFLLIVTAKENPSYEINKHRSFHREVEA